MVDPLRIVRLAVEWDRAGAEVVQIDPRRDALVQLVCVALDREHACGGIRRLDVVRVRQRPDAPERDGEHAGSREDQPCDALKWSVADGDQVRRNWTALFVGTLSVRPWESSGGLVWGLRVLMPRFMAAVLATKIIERIVENEKSIAEGKLRKLLELLHELKSGWRSALAAVPKGWRQGSP
ncbi:hypothetical protein K488DRAFT_74685 [Vararia minispora EC-137]|uniref:Uncharacterized protein n=1 Tax=Vararia minispora EC-137 TaxID=1314806 RepID=A0ACB8Q6U7_9AGAM|nr:hypothetical protein K488DRAFT_74685 [Vararia minispora EC-137]